MVIYSYFYGTKKCENSTTPLCSDLHGEKKLIFISSHWVID